MDNPDSRDAFRDIFHRDHRKNARFVRITPLYPSGSSYGDLNRDLYHAAYERQDVRIVRRYLATCAYFKIPMSELESELRRTFNDR